MFLNLAWMRSLRRRHSSVPLSYTSPWHAVAFLTSELSFYRTLRCRVQMIRVVSCSLQDTHESYAAGCVATLSVQRFASSREPVQTGHTCVFSDTFGCERCAKFQHSQIQIHDYALQSRVYVKTRCTVQSDASRPLPQEVVNVGKLCI